MERVMGSELREGMLGEDELREVISLQIVIDSARAAGLEVASPVAAGSHAVLLVYGGEATASSSHCARRVEVRAFDSGLEDVVLADPVARGELRALVEWGGFGDGDAVFLLTENDIEDLKAGRRTSDECLARPERWRALVFG